MWALAIVPNYFRQQMRLFFLPVARIIAICGINLPMQRPKLAIPTITLFSIFWRKFHLMGIDETAYYVFRDRLWSSVKYSALAVDYLFVVLTHSTEAADLDGYQHLPFFHQTGKSQYIYAFRAISPKRAVFQILSQPCRQKKRPIVCAAIDR